LSTLIHSSILSMVLAYGFELLSVLIFYSLRDLAKKAMTLKVIFGALG